MAGIDRFAIMVADQQVIWSPPDDGCGTETTGHTFDRVSEPPKKQIMTIPRSEIEPFLSQSP